MQKASYFFSFQIELSLKTLQAFPAGSGPMDRTTYMFTYVEPQPMAPKLEELLEEYWDLMPEYQVNFMICGLQFLFASVLPRNHMAFALVYFDLCNNYGEV